MASYTKNYELTKPTQLEHYTVDVVNDNAEKIDAALHGLEVDKETREGAQAKADAAAALAMAASIPLSQRGQPGGVASLDETGKLPAIQLPTNDFDPSGAAGAVQANLDDHIADTANPHGVTAAQVGAVPAAEKGAAGGVATLDGNGKIVAAQMPDTGGSAEEVQAHLDEHIADTVKHVTATERTNWNSKAAGNHTHTAAQVDARPADWLPTAAEINAVTTSRTVNGKALSADISLTAADVGSIPASEKEAAGGVPALDSTGKILPKHIGATSSSGTDYSTPRLRNIRAGTADMTAGTSALNSGEIYLVYE